MSDVKGLYYYKNYLLIQMGVNSNRARDRFYLSYANYVSEKRLEKLVGKDVPLNIWRCGMSKQSILFMYSRTDAENWWWLQKDSRTNIGSHFKPYKWDTKRSITRDELVDKHGWIHIGGNSLVSWDE